MQLLWLLEKEVRFAAGRALGLLMDAEALDALNEKRAQLMEVLTPYTKQMSATTTTLQKSLFLPPLHKLANARL